MENTTCTTHRVRVDQTLARCTCGWTYGCMTRTLARAMANLHRAEAKREATR